MKFSLTITDASPSELSALLASLGGSTAVTYQPQPSAAADDGDDNNAPINTSAPAVDSTGLPHDERIHSAAKTLTATGAWRKRKGVSDATVTAVEAELRARGHIAQPAPQPMPPAAPEVTQPVAMPMPPVQQPTQNGYPTGPGYPVQPGNVVVAPQPGTLAPSMPYQQPPMPPVQQAQPMPPQQPPAQQMQPATMDFNAFMNVITQKMQVADASGNYPVDAGYLARVAGEIGQAFNSPVNVITDISSNPAMIQYAVQIMQRDGKW